MDSREVGRLLEECLRSAEAAALQPKQPSEAERLDYCSCRDSLCAELASLLQEATEMKWPFVPEKWQYKQSVSSADKTNLSDLVSKHLPELLAVLKASILAREASTSLAVVFLVDRFLYWTDDSSRLLKITKLLHRRHPNTPVAPQLVIRQARVYLNSGKLQKAEYILSSLINNNGATGCWVYHSESDKALVQAVSVQVRGVILQKLGLWLEAAGLIQASLIGFYSLPQPDKKGISTSLGILANILISMNDEDFRTFRTNSEAELPILGDEGHRLLSAARAAKMAVIYSQYTSFYVLTNVAIQGTCLLSYSFSLECPDTQRRTFLLQAREAFAIGLLTKWEGELITSQQELHTFLKTTYSLTVAHKWLGTARSVVAQAAQCCRKALAIFYDYCSAAAEARERHCAEIMTLVARVKLLLRVEPFPNSEKGSFAPDSYRKTNDASVKFALEGFFRVMQRFQKYHASLCKTTESKCNGANDKPDGARPCITALGTTIGTLNTQCITETCKVPNSDSNSPVVQPPHNRDVTTTLESTDGLGSSWQNFSLSSSGSPRPSGAEHAGRIPGRDPGPSSKTVPGFTVPSTSSSSSSGASGMSGKFEAPQAGIETLDSVEDWSDDAASGEHKPQLGTPQSLSQLTFRSGSLSDSFGSQSSWEKLSADLNSPTNRKHQSTGPPKDPDGSLFLLETLDSETSNSAEDPATPDSKAKGSTDTSTESSFEMLEENPSVSSDGSVTGKAAVSQRKNPSCYSCLKDNPAGGAAPQGQYHLSHLDYQALLAGLCHECLLSRLHSNSTQFKLKDHGLAYSALHLKFSKATGLWSARETCAYIGKPMGMEGKQRTAIWVQFLHQEERLSSYVGKDYLKPKPIQFHLRDVERQMAAQHYVTEFNKSLYDREVMAQIFFIPSEALLILNGDEIVGCVTVEPYMLGDFVKLTNNTGKKDKSFQATEYGLAFGHFTYLFSCRQEVVVDLQGWVTANGKGLTYLTDPQIHSVKTPKGPSNFAARGLRYFLEDQHGPECNSICQLLKLPPLGRPPDVLPQSV